jgi:hypothetical protein
VQCTIDVEVACITAVAPAADVTNVSAAWAGGGGSGDGAAGPAHFAALWAGRVSEDLGNRLEWQRLLQFVGGGPYGSLYKHPLARKRLQAALVAAMQAECASRNLPNSGGSGSGGGALTTDDDVFDAVHACFHGEVVGSADHVAAAAWSTDRTSLRAREVAALAVKAGGPFASASAAMLDVGCADGAITAAVGQLLGLPPTSVHGCDPHNTMQARPTPSAAMAFA